MSRKVIPITPKPTAQIIEFPKDKIVRHHTVEGFNDHLQEAKEDFIEYIMQKHSSALMNRLNLEGLDVDNPKYAPDVVFVFESVKALISRISDTEHPLHKFVDRNFSKEMVDILQDIGDHHIDIIDDEDDDGDDDGPVRA